MEANVNVDLITNQGIVGSNFANSIATNGLNVGAMKPFLDWDETTRSWKPYISVFMGGDRTKMSNYQVIPQTNATLRRDEWKLLDEAVTQVARERLVGIGDLESAGLVYNLNNALGTTIFEWHDLSDSQEAEITMDAVARGKGDRPVFKHRYIPIPIIHVDYEINDRFLQVARNNGNPIDAYYAEHAARRVAEKLEDMLFTNDPYSYGETDAYGRNTIYGYVNFPDRNEVVLPLAWNDSAKDGEDIVNDVLSMKQASIEDYHYGPWQLYIPTAYETILDRDYDSTTPGTTIRERIMKISGINGIKVVDRLGADNLLLVEMKSDTVRLIKGLALTNLQMPTEFGLVHKFKVMTIQVIQMRSDQNGRCGLVHMA